MTQAPLNLLTSPDGAVCVPLTTLTPLRLTGADRLDFLHGQVSGEVKGLQVGQMSHALLLNVKGHALALLRVYRRQDDLFAAVEDGGGALVKAELQAHIVFDQVTIEDLSDTLRAFTLQGRGVREVLKRALGSNLPADGHFVEVPFADAKVLLAPVRRSSATGVDLHVLSRDAEALQTALLMAGAQLAGDDWLTLTRITAGLPSAAGEGGEGVLPQECGLAYAVSYRKGCYLGQEIMARLEARGNVRRRLLGVKLNGQPDDKALRHQGKEVGRLGSFARHPELGWIGLAVVRLELSPGAELTAGGTQATLAPLPFS
ncbi:MAG: folate-binding protein YgfZ [Truepera sp.]|nr:folate-binding protein YgfZ [Truepera sp.]